jgi:hypothetical protein
MLEETNLHCYVHCDTWQLAYFQSVIKVVFVENIESLILCCIDLTRMGVYIGVQGDR